MHIAVHAASFNARSITIEGQFATLPPCFRYMLRLRVRRSAPVRPKPPSDQSRLIPGHMSKPLLFWAICFQRQQKRHSKCCQTPICSFAVSRESVPELRGVKGSREQNCPSDWLTARNTPFQIGEFYSNLKLFS